MTHLLFNFCLIVNQFMKALDLSLSENNVHYGTETFSNRKDTSVMLTFFQLNVSGLVG